MHSLDEVGSKGVVCPPCHRLRAGERFRGMGLRAGGLLDLDP